jgi:transposase
MRIDEDVRRHLELRFATLLPLLNERQSRLALGLEARLLGHGGVQAVARASGVSVKTVRRGLDELDAGGEELPVDRSRRAGGGRKAAQQKDPEVVPALLALVEPDERGDPMSALRWTTKSLRHLAEELRVQGHPVSAPTVGKLLRANGFSLQATSKTVEGGQHPDRDAQFRYINEHVMRFRAEAQPVVSVDAKKKEQLGLLPAPGREYRPKGEPVRVSDHSFFADREAGIAIPYGVYDLTTDSGWVSVGVDHDTSAFAVATIRRWWQAVGVVEYPDATRLLITADAGGSNNTRYRLWKAELAKFAAECGLSVTVCHFPPGTSKWNKIEHRLFSHITMNQRGRPLTSHEVLVSTIAATRTRTGLSVRAELDPGNDPIGIAVSHSEFAALPIRRHATHGQWNYTIDPAPTTVTAPRGDARAHARAEAMQQLADPRLTGMTREDLNELCSRLAPAQAAQTEQRCYEQRGGPRRRARGAGGTALLCDADKILITIVYQRQIASQRTLEDLIGVNANSIGEAIAQTRQLLHDQHITIPTARLRFRTAEDLTRFVTNPTHPTTASTTDTLNHPSLTGLTRDELADLTSQVLPILASRREKHRHTRRGGQRLPGARGGVFLEKINDPQRVLVAILHRRNIGTHDTLADLFNVSRRTIGEVIREISPILDSLGHCPQTIPTRYPNSEAVRATLATTDTPT